MVSHVAATRARKVIALAPLPRCPHLHRLLALTLHGVQHRPPNMDNSQQEVDQSKYIDNAIRAVREKKPLPEIDFTLHTMEDGTQVSTQERVCKGMPVSRLLPSFPCSQKRFCNSKHSGLSANRPVPRRRASTRLPPAQRRAILLTARSHQAEHPVPEATLLPRRPLDRTTGAMDPQEGHRNSKVGAKHAGNGRPNHRVWRRPRPVL